MDTTRKTKQTRTFESHKLTPEQRRQVNGMHAAYCARLWAQADAAMRNDLLAAPWFDVSEAN